MKKTIFALVIASLSAIIACSSPPSAEANLSEVKQASTSLGCPLPPFGTFANETFTVNSGNCVGVSPTLVEMVSLVGGNQLPQDYPWNAYKCQLVGVTSATQPDGSCQVTWNQVNICNVNNYPEGYINGTANFYQDNSGVWHLTGNETMEFHGNPFRHQNQCSENVSFSMN